MEQDRNKVLKQLGNRIRNLRKEKGFNQEDFADEAGIERSYMGSIERGERNPTYFKIYKIAKALKITLSQLLDFTL